MADAELVRRRLRELGRRVAALRALRDGDEAAFLRDLALQAQAERHLQIALQTAIDVALHIVATETDATPDDYGSAFTALADSGVIPPDLGSRLRLAAGLRNILVHAYLDVDPERIWAQLARLDDLVSLASHVDAHLSA